MFWYAVPLFCNVGTWGVSIPTDYVTDAVFCVDVADDEINVEVRVIHRILWGPECLVVWCVLFVVASGVDVSNCALSVDHSTGRAFLVSEAGVAPSTKITFVIPCSSILVVCEVTADIRNRLTAFDRSLDRGSSSIRSAAVFSVGGRWTCT